VPSNAQAQLRANIYNAAEGRFLSSPDSCSATLDGGRVMRARASPCAPEQEVGGDIRQE